jgi:carboxypeptidase family protein
MIRRHVLPFLLGGALAGCAWLDANAQETTGRIVGRAMDSHGNPVASARVTAEGPSVQGVRGTVTNDQGRFTLLLLPVGSYTVRIGHAAYRDQDFSDIRVRLGQATDLGDVRLIERVQPMEEVVVSGHPPIYDPGSTTIGGVLESSDYDALPVDRDYKSVAALLPHANQSVLGDPVNFAGATGLENRYFVDGVDVTDPFRNATGSDLPYNFVREVQVRTGGYEPEYRSALGGSVNVVTYSGGNDLSAQVFGYFTNNTFSATPRSTPGTPSQGDYSLYDFGFGLGGAIQRDRLWYFVAYDPTFHREDVAIPGWGAYSDHLTKHSFAAKLTWQASPQHSFVLTTIGDPQRGVSVTPPLQSPLNVDPFLADVRAGGVNLILEGRHLLGSHVVLQSSLSAGTRDETRIPSTELGRTEPLFVDSTGVSSGGAMSTDNKSRALEAGLRGTWITGNHEVKAGAAYRTTRLEFDTHSLIVIQLSATSYTEQGTKFLGHVSTRAPAFFLQDAWHATSKLEFRGGVRWDGQYWVSSEGNVAQAITDQWQPRLGAAYELSRRQRLFGSFGRYFQDLTTSPLFWYYNKSTSFFGYAYDHDPRTDPSGATTIYASTGGIQPRLDGLDGQSFDEFSLGYERQITSSAKAVVRGMYRSLRQGIEDGYDPATGAPGLANPGLGALVGFPDMKRNYTALELACQGHVSKSLNVVASYVLSRNYGNYEGLFDSRYNNPFPNTTGLYDITEGLVNAEGLLPNDRTHVLKLSESYLVGHGFTAGAIATWESGAPVSELGAATTLGYSIYLRQRGTAGRTPSLWDLDVRLGYSPPSGLVGRWHPRLTLDAYHVASQRKATRLDELHYRSQDGSGNQTDPNPTYLQPISYQPPMAMRLGFESRF